MNSDSAVAAYAVAFVPEGTVTVKPELSVVGGSRAIEHCPSLSSVDIIEYAVITIKVLLSVAPPVLDPFSITELDSAYS